MPESLVASLSRFRRSHEFWLLIVILVICVNLGVANGQFLTVQNLFDLLTSYAFVGILALGLLVVLIAGGIDISFTATASVAQYVALAVANAYGANWFIVFAIAIGVGGTLGAINAILIQKLRIPSIIVSVATLNIFYGLLIFFTGGKYIYSLPDWFEAEMSQVHEQIKRIGYGQAPDLDGVGDVPRAIAAPNRNAH
jgi:simple sugar transport system permease protein